MLIKFYNVVFESDDFTGLSTDSGDILLHAGGKSFCIETYDDLAVVQDKLIDILSKAKKGEPEQNKPENKGKELLDNVSSLFEELSPVVSDIVSDVKSKIVSKSKNAVLDSFINKITKSFDDIVQNEPSTKHNSKVKKPSTGEKRSSKSASDIVLQDVFGFETTSTKKKMPKGSKPKESSADLIIGDLTSPELEEAISSYVDEVLSEPGIKEVMDIMLQTFNSTTNDNSLDFIKLIIYTEALNHVDKTVADVVNMFFRQ